MSSPSPPGREVATPELAGRSCPYCRFPVKEQAGIIICPTCHAAHHEDCWAENQGCSVVGCVSGPAKPGAQAPPAAVASPAAAATVVQAKPVVAPRPPEAPPSGIRGLVIAGAVLALVAIGAGVALLLQNNSSSESATDAAATVVATVTAPTQEETTPTVETTPPSSPPRPPRVVVEAQVLRTCGATGHDDCYLSLRAEPNSESPELGRIPNGHFVRVVCQVTGEEAESSVLNNSSRVWSRTTSGAYVANIYLEAPRLDHLRRTLRHC